MLRLQIAWGLIFLIGQASLAIADQISIGINNKNITIPNATLSHHSQFNQFTQITNNFFSSSSPTVTSSQGLINDLDKRNDRLSNVISKLIEKGDFDKAQKKIDQELRGLSTTAQSLAFYFYIQGGIYLVQQKYLPAERSLSAAFSLAPSNCKYRGLLATTLIGLDRYTEASRIIGGNENDVKVCLRNGDILDRGRILLAQTHIAIEDRDETATVNLVYAFESSISLLFANKTGRGKLNEGAVLACAMESLIQSIWKHDALKQTRFNSGELCNKLSEKSNRKSIRDLFSAGIINASLGRLGDFNPLDQDHREPFANIEKISDQIKLVELSPNFKELGFDEVQRSTVLGRLFFLRGALQLRSLDFAAAAKDLKTSYAKLEPFASLSHPEAFSIYATIVQYSRLMELSTSPGSGFYPLILKSSEKTFHRMMKEVTNAQDYDETPQTCRAILISSLVLAFESNHKLEIISTEKKTKNSNPDFESSSHQMMIEQVSLVSNEDEKNVKSKLSSCMKSSLSRNSLLYDEFMVSILTPTVIDSPVRMALLWQGKNISDLDKLTTMQAMEEMYTKTIAAYDRLVGFPKYYEDREVLRGSLSKRARWREQQANYNGARSDLERNVNLSKRFGSKLEVMQALGFLSSFVMRHFNEPTVTALQAQEAFINGIEYISGKEPRSCAIVMFVSGAGHKAARRWLNVGRWDKAVATMQKTVKITELHMPICRSMSSSENANGEASNFFTEDIKRALEIMGDNSSDYVGKNLPINLGLIKKYSEDHRIGDFKQEDKYAASLGIDGDFFYPLILELRGIANIQAEERNKF